MGKTFDELTFSDDFMFCRIMMNESICKKVIKTMLGVEVGRIEYLNKQQMMDLDYDKHGIRMDVYVKNSDSCFVLEMQNSQEPDIVMRARYYHSLCDLDFMERKAFNDNNEIIPPNEKYTKLKKQYVMFFCKKDPFGAGSYKYSVKQSCPEKPQIDELINDKRYCIYYNTSRWMDCPDEDVRAFLKYVNENVPESSLTEEIDSCLNHSKGNEVWRKQFMSIEEMKYWAKKEGRAEGLAEGLAEGREEGLVEGREEGLVEGALEASVKAAKNFLKMGLSMEQVAQGTGLSLENVKKIAEELKIF